MSGWEAIKLDELDAIPVADGLVWRPVRRRLGITAFGINAYTSEAAGMHVVEPHDETGSGAGGHEEVYVVVKGRARFTLDGESLDAPAGTVVYVSDPKVRREAVAEEEGTLVLAVGGEPGHAYEVSAWETYFAAIPHFRAERWEEAIAMIEEGLREKPGNPGMLFNLACAEARAGHTVEALTHLRQAIEGDPKYREAAARDSDFDSLRREPGYPG